MKTNKSRKLALVLAVMMLVLAFSTTGFASYLTKTLQVNYRNITVFVNGVQKNLTHEPFIIDGTTYVPLRDMSEIMGNTVGFNPATYRIDITDMGDAGLQYEIYIKDARIKELEAKLNEKESSSGSDLSTLERDLVKKYDDIDKLDVIDIKLKGDKRDIKVEVVIDTKDSKQYDAWTRLRDRDFEDYLQDIVDAIRKEYKDADITGAIYDKYEKENVVEFSIDKKDNVELGSQDKIKKLSELQTELNKKFDSKRKVEFDIVVKEVKGETEVDIWAEKGKLRDLTDREIDDYLEDVCEFIVKKYSSNDIKGLLWDEVDEITFKYRKNKLSW